VKPPGDLAVGVLGVALGGRGVAEQLRRRVELLVDLQPGDEPQLLVVVLGGRVRTHYASLRRRATKRVAVRRGQVTSDEMGRNGSRGVAEVPTTRERFVEQIHSEESINERRDKLLSQCHL